jgi:hypothetical protein
VVDSKRVVWYENPTWKVHTILTSKAPRDNVCITSHDIDGDGHLDLVLGADWNPSNTKSGGTLQWLKRGKSLDEEWSVHPIGGADGASRAHGGPRRHVARRHGPTPRPRCDGERKLDGRPTCATPGVSDSKGPG